MANVTDDFGFRLLDHLRCAGEEAGLDYLLEDADTLRRFLESVPPEGRTGPRPGRKYRCLGRSYFRHP